jgi:cytochrome c5
MGITAIIAPDLNTDLLFGGIFMAMVKNAGLVAVAMSLALTLAGCGGGEEELVLTAEQEKAVAQRLAPEGEITLEKDVVSTAPAIAANAEPRSGEEIYNKACTTCHTAGVGGAPILGDAAVWETRLANGMETLYSNAIQGINAMPPRGLCMDCSDDEVKATVDYMVENSK